MNQIQKRKEEEEAEWPIYYNKIIDIVEKDKCYNFNEDTSKWLSKQRKEYRANSISENKRELLESLPMWHHDPSRDPDSWNLIQVNYFKDKMGFFPRTKSEIVRERYIAGFYIGYCRKNSNSAKSDMTQSIEQKERFEQRVKELAELYKKYDKLPRNNSQCQNEKSLHRFISRIRLHYTKGTIQKYQIDAINKALPNFSWRPFVDLWDYYYKRAITHDWKCGKRTKEDISLRNWVEKQISSMYGLKESTLTEEQVGKIMNLKSILEKSMKSGIIVH